MSHGHTGGVLGNVLKTLLISTLKLAALVVAYALKFTGIVLHKLSELIEKLIGHD